MLGFEWLPGKMMALLVKYPPTSQNKLFRFDIYNYPFLDCRAGISALGEVAFLVTSRLNINDRMECVLTTRTKCGITMKIHVY